MNITLSIDEHTADAARKAGPRSRYKVALTNRRAEIISRIFAQAQNEQGAGRFDEAELLYKRALAVDPQNERARAALALLERDRRHAVLVIEAREALKRGDSETAQRLAGCLRVVGLRSNRIG